MTYVGQLLAAGLAKESIVGTLVTPPTEFIPFIPPETFMPSIALLESTAVRSLPDKIYKAAQGGAKVGGKIKWESEPENIGNLLMGTFGADSTAEVATFVVQTGVNDAIDFTENGGSQVHATLAAGTYAMGTSSAQAGTLCALVKTALQAAGAGTYTVTYSTTTKKMTITKSATTIQILWLTGTNNATSAHTLVGFSKTDTSNAIAVTSDSTTTVPVFAHTLTRVAAAQLPTYSWWFNKGAKYLQFTGCMVNKLDLTQKAGEFTLAESEWTALKYDDTGSSQSPSYSPLKAWKFNMWAVNVDGSPVLNYDNIKITFDNMVKADLALNNSIYPAKIYSEGFEVTVAMDLFVEDATQYNKFLAGTAASLNFVLTSVDDVSGAAAGNKYKLTIDIPTANYSVSNYSITNGVLKFSMTARGVYTPGSTKTASAVLQNSVVASY